MIETITKKITRFAFVRAHKRLVIVAVVIILIGGFLILRARRSSSQQPTYTTAQVTRGTVIRSITASGQVETTNSSEVDTNASGVVSQVLVKEGQVVKAGAVIAKLDLDLPGKQRAQQALASYQSAKNSLAQAQTDLYTLQNKEFVANQTFMNGAVASNNVSNDPSYIEQQANWLAAEASYKNQQNVIAQAQLSVNQAWLNYQQTSDSIYAPITGTITGLNLQVGTVIQSSATSSSNNSSTANAVKIANIMTAANPTVKMNLTEIDVPKIKLGDKATLTFDALSGKTFVGKVASIDTVGVVSSNVTTYPVVIELVDSNPEILPNMAATANVIVDSKTDVLTVPTAAVQSANGNTTVRELQNGKLTNVPVTLGLTGDSVDEVTSGVNEGDSIVTAVVTSGTRATTTTGGSPFSALTGNRGFGGAAVRTGGGGAARGN